MNDSNPLNKLNYVVSRARDLAPLHYLCLLYFLQLPVSCLRRLDFGSPASLIVFGRYWRKDDPTT